MFESYFEINKKKCTWLYWFIVLISANLKQQIENDDFNELFHKSKLPKKSLFLTFNFLFISIIPFRRPYHFDYEKRKFINRDVVSLFGSRGKFYYFPLQTIWNILYNSSVIEDAKV